MNSFGNLFRFHTFGESHGPGIGVVIEGLPAGLELNLEEIQKQLDLRKPGQSAYTSPRQEEDQFEILSGFFEKKTLGTPLTFLVKNRDARSSDYQNLQNVFRPGHADLSYFLKYGHYDYRGGGRASARETIARVIAGAVAKQILTRFGIQIQAYVGQIGPVEAWCKNDASDLDVPFILSNELRVLNQDTLIKAQKILDQAKSKADSLGGAIEVWARQVPAGLGSPTFNKLEAKIAQAMLSIPAVKGLIQGPGLEQFKRSGFENLEEFAHPAPEPSQESRAFLSKKASELNFKIKTHFGGGTWGGISNSQDLQFRVYFKAPTSLDRALSSINQAGQKTELQVKGRHDPCVLPRAVVIVEAMLACVLLDEMFLQKAQLAFEP